MTRATPEAGVCSRLGAVAETRKPNAFSARLIEAGAAGLAARAAEILLNKHPDTGDRFGDSAFRSWKEHLVGRVRDLAASLSAGEPQLFVTEVVWSRRAFEAREVPLADLTNSLAALRAALAEELPPDVALGACEVVEMALAELEKQSRSGEDRLRANSETGRLALRYLERTLEGHSREAIDLVLEAVDQGLSVRDAYLEVLAPAQRETGRLWHVNQLGVAQEHLISETSHTLMTLLSRRQRPAPANGKVVITAAVPGNAHDLGLRIVADFFEHAGWRVIHLGADVPAEDLLGAIQAFEADLLALSASLPAQIPEMITSVRQVRDKAPKVRILVGGGALAAADDLWQSMGAHAWAANADDAVAQGARLVGLSEDGS